MPKLARDPIDVVDFANGMSFMRTAAHPGEKCPCGNTSVGYWCYDISGVHEHFYVCQDCKQHWKAFGPLMAITIGGD